MPTNFMPSTEEYFRILPELILTLAGVLIMFLEALRKEGQKSNAGGVTLATLVAALIAAVMAGGSPGPAFHDMVFVDGFGTFFRILVLVVGLLTVLSSQSYLERHDAQIGEYYGLLLFSLVGQSLLCVSNELMMVFIGIEISSIASYIMAGFLRDDKRNNESALKYFLLGSFATAFLLYGVAWIYGITGTTNIDGIRQALLNNLPAVPLPAVGAAAALMLVGFAFKVSAVPFQAWAPDVYQGAPAPVSAFMSAGPKAAAFAVFTRVFLTAFGPIANRWEPILWIVALATMIVGNFAALTQTNIKRMLAYSSIAHAGYVLVAIVAHSEAGTAAVMFYLASYAFMNVGAFAAIVDYSRRNEKFVNISDLAGLGQKQPFTASMMTIYMLSLIGVPLTAGFFGKFYIFKAALESDLIWLTVLGLLNSAVAAYYYLRILVVMWMHEPGEAAESAPEASFGVKAVLFGSALATLVLGILPSLVLDFANRSANIIK
ncbi:NADH-quinone oxidoreductase subunit N [Bryobacterales bacterium F-183]|nr:NADH-quinone oxidoreductase subunit N [Bryobacterales bacterium F-183]